jgi:superfamily II DNA or RNA helicase
LYWGGAVPVNLRDYQRDLVASAYDAWDSGLQNPLIQLSTGGGKTVIFSEIIRRERAPSIAIAHRQELVVQVALSLGRVGVRHRIIAPPKVIHLASAIQQKELGASYVSTNALAAVAGVDTVVRRSRELKTYAPKVKLWVMDEGHHLLRDNKWGAAAQMFSNARGLLVTATPCRTDGKGLGRHADGLADCIIEGPPMRWMIERGYLTDYKIYGVKGDMDVEHIPVGASGDFTQHGLRTAAHKSRSIVGDIVKHYLKFAEGKRGVTFVTDVETAHKVAAAYNAAGVPAEAVSAKTPDRERIEAVAKLRSGALMQLVNVDIFGEGFDLPAIECVSFARPTQSKNLHTQQFGRGLRPMPGKTHATIIDHVGNCVRPGLGLPDAPQKWTLDRRDRKASAERDPDVIPLRTCTECARVYERVLPRCPYCDFKPEPARRDGPEFVDGDLTELDAETLARMRGEVVAANRSVEEYREWLARRHITGPPQTRNTRLHKERLEALQSVKDAIALWGGYQRHHGREDAESYRRFNHRYGIDVLTAQALRADEAAALAAKIHEDIITKGGLV